MGLRQKLQVTGTSGWLAGVERILRQRANSEETLRPSAPNALLVSPALARKEHQPQNLRGWVYLEPAWSGRMTSHRRGVLRASELSIATRL